MYFQYLFSCFFPLPQSKTDIVQESFYVAIGLTMNGSAKISPKTFYSNVSDIFAVKRTFEIIFG
jgi:hypothetical protein